MCRNVQNHAGGRKCVVADWCDDVASLSRVLMQKVAKELLGLMRQPAVAGRVAAALLVPPVPNDSATLCSPTLLTQLLVVREGKLLAGLHHSMGNLSPDTTFFEAWMKEQSDNVQVLWLLIAVCCGIARGDACGDAPADCIMLWCDSLADCISTLM
jgi:hypothetical protein